MMTAFVIQCYPLANSLWTEAKIFNNPNSNFQALLTVNRFDFYLSALDNPLSTNNNVSGALRCALALVVGCSGLMGRATPMDYLMLAILGTFTFELSRQLVANFGIDHFGSFTIFGFGGFLSLGSGIPFLSI